MSSFGDLVEFGVPTLDRPFGLQLWPLFNRAFELVVGYPADQFQFVAGSTPMSTIKETGIFIIIYYIIIFGGREVMRSRDAFKLKALFLVHNYVLTVVSFVLLVLYAEQLIPTVVRHGIFHAICSNEGGWTQQLVVLYYVSGGRRGRTQTSRETNPEHGLTPTAHLPDQVPGAPRHRLPVPQEEASQYVLASPRVVLPPRAMH